MDSANQMATGLGLEGANGSRISNKRRWSVVGLLFAASFINYLDRGTLSVALPLISADLTLRPTTKGLVLSAFFWSYALLQVPMGWCVDRVNLRWLYAAMFALWSLACGLTGLAGSLAVLLALRVLLGVGESIYLVGATKIVSALFAPQARGLPSGLFSSSSRAGMALGAPLIAWLVVHYGWRRMFFLVGFSSLLWLVPWLLFFPSRLPKGKAGPVSQGIAMAPPHPRVLTVNRNLLGMCLGFFCFNYYWYLLATWLPDYLVQARHLSVFKSGVYASLPYLVIGLCDPAGGWIADRLVRLGYNETRTRKAIVTVGFLSGLLLIPATLVAGAGAAIWLVAGASLVGLATANLLVIVQGCAPPEEVGVWTGMQNFVGNIAGILAPLATGFLISRTGSYVPGFILASVVLVAGILPYWCIVGELKPPARPSR